MWWSDASVAARAAALVLVTAGPLVLAGCNVRPLYATAEPGVGVQYDLAGIDIPPVEGRVGQTIRNELLSRFHNGPGSGGDQYRLQLTITESSSSIIVRQLSGLPQGRTVTVRAYYWLYDNRTNRLMIRGNVTRSAPYEWSRQRFANDRAELDAENRAAREVAEEVRMQLSAFFASGGEIVPQSGPDLEIDFTTDRPFQDIDETPAGPGE